ALLAAGAVLGACVDGQPVGPRGAAPDRPSLTLNPACSPGLGGVTHTDSVLAAETWSRANNPHRVNTSINIEGAGVLTLEPGVLVCFGNVARLDADNGGRLMANGLDTARIVLTAEDPYYGWQGVHLDGVPASASTLKHVRIEHTFSAAWPLSTHGEHAATIDSVVVRQTWMGVALHGRGTRFSRSRVDTVTGGWPGVEVGSNVTFEQNTIRGSAGVGLSVVGTHGISLLGGRIEGSADVGLRVTTTGPGFVDTDPIRVVGGASYPAELVVSALPRIYPTLADQDSLLGNARDTLVVTGGILQAWATVGAALPWRVTDDIIVQYFGILIPRPGATLAFAGATVTARNGGRVLARGTAAAPVRFTSVLPPHSWGGLVFEGAPALKSYLTNVRMEYANSFAVSARDSHPVVVDSAVFRQNGQGVMLVAQGSRMSRSRVDTTRIQGSVSVVISANTILESTLIRGSGGIGLLLLSNEVQVLSCEIRESAYHGIQTLIGGAVHNCNLVDNGGVGIHAANGWTLNAEDTWWGDAAGPMGTNGDGASGMVDYTPWRTTPYVLPYVP
ncbi:MAG TPA: right-handed parallel beta-helix repeat-containing protein, partial [Longimicrobium sp.]|nr:right-handed parallel beta-helix repeat-containing protein [Longimicrobium sp.]